MHPPYELAPMMRILLPNPIGSGDHPGLLIFSPISPRSKEAPLPPEMAEHHREEAPPGLRTSVSPRRLQKHVHLRTPQMGLGIGILVTGGNLQGGVHKIQILIRELIEELLRNLFGEEIGFSGTEAEKKRNHMCLLLFFCDVLWFFLGFPMIFAREGFPKIPTTIR